MIVGAYQLWHLRVPDHAAVHETVNACTSLRKPWARGLVNAVMRRWATAGPPSAGLSERSFEHPAWLEDTLRREYPDAEAIMAASNARAPMALRINRRRADPADYVATLDAAGLASRAPHADARTPAGGSIGFGPETRLLDTPIPAARLPGYAEGLVAVQDGGAQLAAPLLTPAAGERLIDACAAPGGKLFHLYERHPGVRCTALDLRPERLEVLQAEAARLGHHEITVLAGDATTLDWWDGEPVRWILLDAPCSGTGTLRRHPDIKLLRRAADIAQAAALQARLLANLWQALAPGGTLLYCTCSILAAENDEVVGDFLARHEDAASQPFALSTGRATRHGWQLLPTDLDTDGFYFSRMTKARA